MDEEEEWPETWDRNRVYMYTDPDGNKVPVPHGFTVSGAESEKYVNHNVEMRGTLEELTWTPCEKNWEHDESDTDKAWKLNEDNVWVSQNNNTRKTLAELVSNEFTIGENGGYLDVTFSMSSGASSSYLTLQVKNTETEISEPIHKWKGKNLGTTYNSLVYAKYNHELKAGKYILTISYFSDSPSGLNQGYVKSGLVFNYNENGINNLSIHKTSGLVIYAGTGDVTESNAFELSKIRNQFVWVPVSDINTLYKIDDKTFKKKSSQNEPSANKYDSIRYLGKYNMLGYTTDMLYKELEIEFNQTMESIAKYGGFYIGRYETGNITNTIPVVRRLNNSTGNQNWYNTYVNIKNINTNSNVKTCLIWGFLWNRTLEWFIETGDKTKADILYSGNWGNYPYSGTYNYIDTNGSMNELNTVKKIPTGSTERNMANNIYDLAGNVWEWTLQNDYQNYRRALRGDEYSSLSSYGTSQTNSVNDIYYSFADDENSSIGKSAGARAYLYILP